MQSQRFSGVPTLEACLAGSHVMAASDPDSAAVTRVQEALADLGYLPRSEVDGVFGDRTGKAVTRFKTDESLSPTDPKVGTGTMQRLDSHFAAEPVDGDAPDPGTGGLDALADQARTTAGGWVAAASQALATWPQPPAPGEAVDPDRQAYEDALRRNFHLQRTADEQVYVDLALRPMLDALPGVLSLLTFLVADRATYLVTSSTYDVCTAWPGLQIRVTPPFRNVLTDEARAVEVLRLAAAFAYPLAQVQGWPGTVRYAGLDTGTALKNTVAWSAFCFEVAGGTAAFRPSPRWYP